MLEAKSVFEKCCVSQAWVQHMAVARPFSSEKELFNRSEFIWFQLEEKDWKEAFAGHPKIGDIESLRKKYAQSKTWSTQEQSGMDEANEKVIQELADLNEKYEKKFGYIFIVCATGKSAFEMLEILKKRIHHSPDDELKIAASEQNKITQIRLQKLLNEI